MYVIAKKEFLENIMVSVFPDINITNNIMAAIIFIAKLITIFFL